jgi:hypothetical protein
MKEIKFRAWVPRDENFNRKESKMYYFDFFSINAGGSVVNCGTEGSFNLNQPSIKIMNFIKLKDKNGKEIYEGDILKHFNPYSNDYNNAPIFPALPVEFGDNKGFQMYLKGIGFYEIYSNYVEVIGNIYENPELLEKSE